VTEPTKAPAPQAIDELYKEGLSIVMLTGGSRKTSDAVANRLNLDGVVARKSAEIDSRIQSSVVHTIEEGGCGK